MKLGKLILAGLVWNLALVAEVNASGYEKILDCSHIETDDIESVYVYNVDGKGEVNVESPDRKTTIISMDEAAYVGIEATLPLPDDEHGNTRTLHNSHTGWVINVYSKDGRSRIPVDCR